MNENFFEPLSAAMEVLGDTMYIGPFRNAIHVGANENYFDIQTGDAFVNVFSHHKSGSNPSANEAMFEMLQEIRRIFGFQNLDINPSGQTLQLTIDGRSYRLSEQGAGFAHFVVVMVNVLVRRPKLLLIDEPELNLHASLQLDFLQTLAKYTEFGVIFATHSLGLARTAGDQIYTLTKPSGGTSVLRSYEDNQDLVTLLGQLSFDNRPEMGFSKVLLVEGKTELRALMQFLRLYGKEHEVLMLPLHGGDLIRPDSEPELTDLLRIGGSMHYIIDSEREVAGAALESSRQGFVDLCERLGVPGLVLERRALENYFTDDAVKRAMGSAAQGLGPYDKLARTPGASWRKTDNWRVASEMRKEDLEDTDLGIFLRSSKPPQSCRTSVFFFHLLIQMKSGEFGTLSRATWGLSPDRITRQGGGDVSWQETAGEACGAQPLVGSHGAVRDILFDGQAPTGEDQHSLQGAHDHVDHHASISDGVGILLQVHRRGRAYDLNLSPELSHHGVRASLFIRLANEQDRRDGDTGLCQHRLRELDVLAGVRRARLQEYGGIGHAELQRPLSVVDSLSTRHARSCRGTGGPGEHHDRRHTLVIQLRCHVSHPRSWLPRPTATEQGRGSWCMRW